MTSVISWKTALIDFLSPPLGLLSAGLNQNEIWLCKGSTTRSILVSVSVLLISDRKGSQIWHMHQSARVFCAASRLCYQHDTTEEVLILECTRIWA